MLSVSKRLKSSRSSRFIFLLPKKIANYRAILQQVVPIFASKLSGKRRGVCAMINASLTCDSIDIQIRDHRDTPRAWRADLKEVPMFWKKFLGMVLLAGMLIAQSVPRALAATYCDQAQFVSDLTAPDGSSFAPGAAFTKTWRLLNIGTCTWSTSYTLTVAGGDPMGNPAPVRLPVNVPPGQMLDISVNLTAPATAGHYKALFKLSNASGVQFGIGNSANEAFWSDINVVDTSAVIYDFLANAPYAQWKSGAGIIPFPGTSGDSRGFGYQVNAPHLEDDSVDSAPGLLVVPQNKFNGYIQAMYPEFQVQQGDRIQTL